MNTPVLFVIPDVPFPLVSGGHLRDWQILNILNALGIKPHVLYFGAGEGYDLAPDNPLPHLTSSLTYAGTRAEHPDRTPQAKIKRKLGYLVQAYRRNRFAATTSFPFSYQYDAMGAGERILAQAKRCGAKVIILRSFWCHHAPQLQKAGVKVIANCPDYNTKLAWEMVKSVRDPLRKVGPLCNYMGIRAQERAFLPCCDEVWVPTAEEMIALGRFIRIQRLLVFPNLVDVKSYPDLSDSAGEKDSLLFIGNYSYTPNSNSAKVLLYEIFPAVKRRCPSAKLYLIGKGLPQRIWSKARQTEGVEAPGFVDDMQVYFRKAAVFVSAVNQGAGMLLKICEALAMGKAVVGFEESFRGMGRGNDEAFLSVSSAKDFTAHVLNLLESDHRRIELGKKARSFAQKELSFEKGTEILCESPILSELLKD